MKGYPNKENTSRRRAITLIELLVVLAIIGILAMIATGSYTNSVTRARISAAFAEIRQMEQACERYYLDTGEYPPSSSGTVWPNADDGFDVSLDQDTDGVGCGYMTLVVLHSLNGDAGDPIDPHWQGPYLDLDMEQLVVLGFGEMTSSTPLPQIQMVDPWGYPYRYVRYDDYDTMGGTKLPTNDPFYATEEYFNVNTFQIISGGPNNTTYPAPYAGMESDDVTNFSRGGVPGDAVPSGLTPLPL